MAVDTRKAEAVTADASGPAVRRGFGRRLAGFVRALANMLATLAVLAVLGVVGDVVLHQVTHVSTSAASYPHIYEIDIVLDGDGSVSVTGAANGTHSVKLTETDTATMFDHPRRTTDVIAGTLYVTARCPDARCTANLVLTASPDVTVHVRMGNAVHLDRASLTLNGLTGPVDVVAWPARVDVADSTRVTGVASGPVTCASSAVCDVNTPS